MHRRYKDIIDRLGKPLWWDGQGVPRYSEFSPEECGVYANYVALLKVGCQGCNETFLVASEVESMLSPGPIEYPKRPAEGQEKKIEEVEQKLDSEGEKSPWELIGSFHYGDPPRHGYSEFEESHFDCSAGDSMNSIPLRIIQFWERDSQKTWEWVRKSEYEFEIPKEKVDNGF